MSDDVVDVIYGRVDKVLFLFLFLLFLPKSRSGQLFLEQL